MKQWLSSVLTHVQSRENVLLKQLCILLTSRQNATFWKVFAAMHHISISNATVSGTSSNPAQRKEEEEQ